MSNLNIPFLRGKDVVIRLYQSGKPLIVLGKQWNVEQNATEANDPVNGEYRDRLDLVTNFYSGSVDLYQADTDAMDRMIDAQAPEDVSGLPLFQAGAVQKKLRDGTRVAYKMSGLVLGPWSESASGRAETGMLTLKFRFQYWEKIQAI